MYKKKIFHVRKISGGVYINGFLQTKPKGWHYQIPEGWEGDAYLEDEEIKFFEDEKNSKDKEAS